MKVAEHKVPNDWFRFRWQADFCGLSFTISEHHAYPRDSRILSDNEDFQKLVGWFESYLSLESFPVSDFVMSINTGILGAETLNCYRAFECGNFSTSYITGKIFEDVNFLRKNRVTPLRGLKSKVKIENEEIPVNPVTLSRRIALLKKSDTELQNYFSYELGTLFIDSLQ
ncbi:hypothetical protein AVEN_150857-1 [Araneus ventricosus]|uniref:Uncharacterized protein n=1 Tax=Araneus ventricosus TaxID=182803 RepID=A0A4Y2V7S9_ARAVE|nr:hypothetical protein AVEN_150857-1 [Araneus ventricosus]